MTIYYIDLSATTNGDGTEVTPYNALTNLPTLVAGDIVKLKRGSYQKMPSKYTVTASGTATAWITFEDYGVGDLPILETVNDTSGCIDAVSRSYILIKNIQFVGPVSSLNQGSYGVLFNGGGAYNYIENCSFKFLGIGINLSAGFNKTNIRIKNTECLYNNSDGIRLWSLSGTFAWDTIDILDCNLSFNGRAGGANGNGFNSLIQTGHTGVEFKHITIRNCVLSNNQRDGLSLICSAVSWDDLVTPAWTTPPLRLYKGVVISNCTIESNGESGMHLMSIAPGTKLPFLVLNNRVNYNSVNDSLGNIWTGGCTNGLVIKNKCIGAKTNGTITGDGCGIFDDQWNDGMVIAFNFISSNTYINTNPDYSSYGIGLYRATNSLHVGNVIRNCRYGYVIGIVQGATAPTMANIIIEHNTFINIEKSVVSLWTALPSSCILFRENVVLNAAQDVEAQSAQAGLQSWERNYAYRCTVKYTGNNVGSGAWDHTNPNTDLDKDGFPTISGSLYRAGTYTNRLNNINGTFYNPPSIGAYEPYVSRGVR